MRIVPPQSTVWSVASAAFSIISVIPFTYPVRNKKQNKNEALENVLETRKLVWFDRNEIPELKHNNQRYLVQRS